MIEELSHLIKQDEDSQKEFQKFIEVSNENVKLQDKKMLKRARRVALTLGFASVLVIILFTFALVTKMKSKENIQTLESELNSAQIELANCLNGAE